MFSHRFASLPIGLRVSITSFGQHASSRTSTTLRLVPPIRHFHRTNPSYVPFFTKACIRPPAWRRLWWVAPVVGGVVLCYSPGQPLHLPSIFSSPTLIPCNECSPRFPEEEFIGSPHEPHRSIAFRIFDLLRDHVWEPILTARRFIYLFYLFVPVIISTPMLLVGKAERRLSGDRWGAVWWYNLLVSRMEAAGPTFIKLAQWAASRADLFPFLLCEKMGALQSHAKKHSFEHTKRIIERVFQRPFHEVFEEFDESPIGTGAIAQVYKGTLKQDLIPISYLGPKRQAKLPGSVIAPVIMQDPPPSVPTASVAIKILHPRIQKTIARDLAIMSFFANIITLIPGVQWISLPEEVYVFGDMMRQQLDLRHEAENLVIFEKNFAPRNVPVTFPRPLKEFSSREILVEEYENALPLELFLRNGGGPYDEQVATLGLDAFLNMLLLDNFVHSDLHAGNIMIKFTKPPTTVDFLRNMYSSLFKKSAHHLIQEPLESDTIVGRLRELRHSPPEWQAELTELSCAGYIPEIVFIDTGLITTLNSTNRKNFLDLFRAVAEFDGYRTGQLMVERCRTPELAIETETFALKMQHIVLSVKRKTFSLGQIKISDILTDVLVAVRQHHVKMEGDFINTVISILLLEGIGRRLDPTLDLFKSALPILRQLGRQMTAQESMTQLPQGNLASLLKVWVWLEARQLASSAFINVDNLVKYDQLVPSV
ncbi:ABC1-domain-containing protein [Coniophora puteana RWD-64-598 SS2]|uniref:ABC1-domain-containing protein n=1 Tax=Coniophora puteana (strain RWD-64-598) TaxID=741705 RepID=A0A5M3N871_CONPW|nr:ABC1-domain-containing protein [Coniophora puteana RWD-64-598 SS2]EIW87051.1 ABC1-domain-containing protein [Coniophora puteana RWD-64-598 SS2]